MHKMYHFDLKLSDKIMFHVKGEERVREKGKRKFGSQALKMITVKQIFKIILFAKCSCIFLNFHELVERSLKDCYDAIQTL